MQNFLKRLTNANPNVPALNEFDEVMTQIGFGRIHLLAMLTNGLLQMLTLHETMGMGIIAPASICDLNLNMQQQSVITAAPFLGIICSSYFWGYMTDKWGRRWILLRTITLSNLCSIVSMFMIRFTDFFVMRFLTGIFVGGPSFVAITYLSEFCSRKTLSRVITFTYMFNGFAMLYCPGLATIVFNVLRWEWAWLIYGRLSYRPWRLLGHLFIIPGVIAFLLLLMLPESPKFLFMVGQENKAIAVLNWMCIKHTGASLNQDQVAKMRIYSQQNKFQRGKRRTNFLRQMLIDSMPLFRHPYVKYFLCSCVVMFSLCLIANGLGLWFTDMRNRVNRRDHHEKGLTVCEGLFGSCDRIPTIYEEDALDDMICNAGFHGFWDSLKLGVAFIVMYKFCGILLNVLDRKVLFILALMTSTTSGFLLVVVTTPFMQVICFLLFLAMPGVVVSLLGGALLEFVPTHLRGKAVCICWMWGRLGAVTGTYIVGYFVLTHCEVTFMLISLFPLLSVAVESYLPI